MGINTSCVIIDDGESSGTIDITVDTKSMILTIDDDATLYKASV